MLGKVNCVSSFLTVQSILLYRVSYIFLLNVEQSVRITQRLLCCLTAEAQLRLLLFSWLPQPPFHHLSPSSIYLLHLHLIAIAIVLAILHLSITLRIVSLLPPL